uniref:Uncharacterized protein n=1 Tax=Arcella intermedia TaxID=1963864 RepID=A0A6B2LTW5_9EUKA
MRSSLSDEALAGKLSGEDKGKINGAIDSALGWFEKNPNASKEEFEAKQKELEGVAMPIMAKLAGGAGGPQGGFPEGGFPGGAPGGGRGPTVDDVD